MSTHHRRRAAAYRDYVTEASLARRMVSTVAVVDSMPSIVINKEPDCVLHRAEFETFQRSVVARCTSQPEILGQVVAIWMEKISAGAPRSEVIAAICVQLPDLSAVQAAGASTGSAPWL